MKVEFRVSDTGELVLEEKSKKKLAKKLHPGAIITAKIDFTEPRSLPQHSRYWGVLSAFCDSIPESYLYNFWVTIIDDLTRCEEIEPIIIHNLLKQVLGVTSESFETMDHYDACDFFNKADERLERWASALQEV